MTKVFEGRVETVEQNINHYGEEFYLYEQPLIFSTRVVTEVYAQFLDFPSDIRDVHNLRIFVTAKLPKTTQAVMLSTGIRQHPDQSRSDVAFNQANDLRKQSKELKDINALIIINSVYLFVKWVLRVTPVDREDDWTQRVKLLEIE